MPGVEETMFSETPSWFLRSLLPDWETDNNNSMKRKRGPRGRSPPNLRGQERFAERGVISADSGRESSLSRRKECFWKGTARVETSRRRVREQLKTSWEE